MEIQWRFGGKPTQFLRPEADRPASAAREGLATDLGGGAHGRHLCLVPATRRGRSAQACRSVRRLGKVHSLFLWSYGFGHAT